MDLEDYSTIELKIPEELKAKGRIAPANEISFLHYEGKYKIDMK